MEDYQDGYDPDDKPSLSDRFDAIKEAMDEVGPDEDDFDKIPDAEKLHPSSDLCAQLKLASLMKTPAGFGLHGEHDIVLFSCGEDDFKEPLTDDDIRYLIRCGVRWDGEYDGLGMFASL